MKEIDFKLRKYLIDNYGFMVKLIQVTTVKKKYYGKYTFELDKTYKKTVCPKVITYQNRY
ncbi:exotoxin beta-grasp domain-containing protein [Staphylococcus aureus]